MGMIRQPTPAAALYRWWNDALAGLAPEVHDGLPEAGFYRTRLVKGGPWVAVEIKVIRDIDLDTGELEGPERLVALCDGMRRDAARLWTFLTPISRDEYRALLNRRESIPAMAATLAPLDLSKEPMTP
jgi:hypothetical protein